MNITKVLIYYMVVLVLLISIILKCGNAGENLPLAEPEENVFIMIGIAEESQRNQMLFMTEELIIIRPVHMGKQIEIFAKDGTICRVIGHKICDGKCVICGIDEKLTK